MPMEYEHLLIFGGVCVATWLLFIYFWPRMMLSVYKRAILVKGFGDGPVPINTLYTQPQALFADPLHRTRLGSSKLVSYWHEPRHALRLGWLDLSKGPQVLHVPDMAGRYYSVQFTDPSKNTNFAYVGKRTTGTQAGDYLITGPGWKGTVPQRDDADILAEQLGARHRPRLRRERQRPPDRLWPCKADTTHAARPLAISLGRRNVSPIAAGGTFRSTRPSWRSPMHNRDSLTSRQPINTDSSPNEKHYASWSRISIPDLLRAIMTDKSDISSFSSEP